MIKKQKLPFKSGDKVKIISGFYKNEISEIIKVDSKTGKVILKNINIKFKHLKSNSENEIGEIKKFEAPIHHSNIKKYNS